MSPRSSRAFFARLKPPRGTRTDPTTRPLSAGERSFVLVYILFHLGHIPFFKPKRYPVEDVLEKQRDWRYPLQHSIVHAMGVGPDLKMPPGDKRLEEHRRARDQPAIDAANASRRARGLKDHAPKKEISDTQMALIQIAGTLFVLFIFTAIWYAVTYINRDTKEPPEPMKMSLVAFLPGWAGELPFPAALLRMDR